MVWQQGGQGGRSGTPKTPTTPTQFTAPTTGLEDVWFKTDTFQDAADFLETKDKLARYVGTCNYRGAATASRIMDTLPLPTFTDVIRPDQPTFKDEEGTEVDKTQKEILVLNYSMEISTWIEDVKVVNAKKRDWEENGPKLYNLLLQHCPKTVIIKLQGQPDYEANTVSRDPVKLLVMLRDMAHNHDSTKDETMAIVESDMKLFIGFQGKTESVDEFLCLF